MKINRYDWPPLPYYWSVAPAVTVITPAWTPTARLALSGRWTPCELATGTAR